MLRRALSGFVVLVLAASAWAQEGSPAAPPEPQQGAETQSPSAPEKQPSRLRKMLNRAGPNCVNLGGTGKCWSDSQQEKDAKEKQAQEDPAEQQQQPPLPPNQAPPRSEPDVPRGVSSSRTNVDLSPPPNDEKEHEGAAISDVEELHAYDPHKAMKNVEVGDFYFKRGNYAAAESRYAEALQWKPNDAAATYHLAESQEKLGKVDQALKNYLGYLKILPRGEYAEGARQGIERVRAKAQSAPTHAPGKLQSQETPPPSAQSGHTPR